MSPMTRLTGVLALTSLLGACGGGEKPAEPAAAPVPTPEATVKVPEGPGPTLLVSQAQFIRKDGKPVPGPAKLVLLKMGENGVWVPEVMEDPESNVFHKAVVWRNGILTIGAEKARVVHWTRGESGWKSDVIWQRSWGGSFDRMRDLEIGDVNGDGKENLVVATHDEGVVAVGSEVDGKWSFMEMDQTPDTFIHEVEIGDVDGDGKAEFYVTPSDRNTAGKSQPGGVTRYDWDGTTYKRSTVVHWDASHAKEILVADVNADGRDELYVVREAHTETVGGKKKIIDPVAILRYDYVDGKPVESTVTTLDDEQTRFLLMADADHDGKNELVAAGMKSGLWMIDFKDDGTIENVLIDRNSGGFEHATHAADLDGDGKVEIYVASDNQGELRQYTWTGDGFRRRYLEDTGDDHITWNIQDGVF